MPSSASLAIPSAPSRFDARFLCASLLALILISSFLIKLNHLGHASLKALDESFHAVVAKNLIKHPLTPTLYDHPYLPYDYRDWQSNHVWLHKPIVPLWQMAASMKLLGVNTLALRLPSAILATLAVWLTYAIGVELLDRRAALIAAALQAFNPALVYLVQGYVFSDHVDVAFLFWVELSIYFLIRAIKTGGWRWTIAAGIAQGISFLCKTYPAFIISGIALIACLLSLAGLAPRSFKTFRFKHFWILLLVTLITIAPWMLWCYIEFRREFLFEQVQIFRHLDRNVEGWAAPWDRLIFDYALRIYHVFYPAVLVATILLIWRGWRERSFALLILLAWGFGVLIPHLLATSKTPTATLIGWPAFLLLLSAMIVRAIDGDALCLGGWLGAVVIGVVWHGSFHLTGFGYPNPPRFAGVMLENIWVCWHLLIALATAITVAVILPHIKWRKASLVLMILAGLATLDLGAHMTRIAWKITEDHQEQPDFAELGALIRTETPANAVLLLEINQKCEHIMAMFQTDRSVYPVTMDNWRATAHAIQAAGGLPLLVTPRVVRLPQVFDTPADGWWVYAIVAPATSRATTDHTSH